MEPLVDSFGRRHDYLRLSVTDRCNLRCVYCMPPAGIAHRDRAEILRFDEIARLARVFAGLGVRKVRLTGGEPLVRRGVAELAGALAQIAGIETLAMTTNGVLLSGHARALREAGLGRLNISLDTLRPERFERITLAPLHGRVLAGIDAALEAGFAPLSLNVVIMGGINDDELLDFVAFARERPLRVRFIEFMPFKANAWGAAGFVPYAVMRRAIEARHQIEEMKTGGVAREFRVAGHRGTIGFITAISEHFCAGCGRLRLTADGSLKTCLFAPPAISLRDPLRAGESDEALGLRIRAALAGKRETRPEMAALTHGKRESMIEIGG